MQKNIKLINRNLIQMILYFFKRKWKIYEPKFEFSISETLTLSNSALCQKTWSLTMGGRVIDLINPIEKLIELLIHTS